MLRYGEQQELQPELKIDKTQTQVDLQFLSQSDQLKFTTLAPQIQKLPEIKIVCSSIFVFIKTAVSHNPLNATNPKLAEFSLFQQHIQGVHLLFLKNFNIRQLLKKRC